MRLTQAAETEKKEEGFFEGLFAGMRLIATRSYIFGILIVSTIYEAISQIIEYQMHVKANAVPQFSGELGFSTFLGYYGITLIKCAMTSGTMDTLTAAAKYNFHISNCPIITAEPSIAANCAQARIMG